MKQSLVQRCLKYLQNKIYYRYDEPYLRREYGWNCALFTQTLNSIFSGRWTADLKRRICHNKPAPSELLL